MKKNFKSIKIYYEITKPFSTKQPPDDTLAPTLHPQHHTRGRELILEHTSGEVLNTLDIYSHRLNWDLLNSPTDELNWTGTERLRKGVKNRFWGGEGRGAWCWHRLQMHQLAPLLARCTGRPIQRNVNI